MKGKIAATFREITAAIRANKIRTVVGAIVIALLLVVGVAGAALSRRNSSAGVAEPKNEAEQVADTEKSAEEEVQSGEVIQETAGGEQEPIEATDGQNKSDQSLSTQADTEQMPENQGSNRNSSTATEASQTEGAKPAASGKSSQKKPIYKTIHHDAVTESRYVVDQRAYDEPIYKTRPVWVIADGAKFYSAEEASEYTYNKTVHGDGTRTSSSVQYEKYQDGVKHHSEQGHNETVVVKPAWDETVIAGWE